MIHGFFWMAKRIPEVNDALAHISAFISDRSEPN